MTARPLQPHGTLSRIQGRPASGIAPCNCEVCADYWRQYNRKRQIMRELGRPGRVPATVAADHARKLLAAGMSWQETADAAGISRSCLSAILRPDAVIAATTHARVLAVPLPAVTKPGRQHVDGTGTRRMVQALMRAQWSREALAEPLGVSASRVWQLTIADHVTAGTRDRMREVYRRLEGALGPSLQTARLAERRGWPRPIDWEGVDIDDPAASPRQAEDLGPKPLVVLENYEFVVRTEGGTDEAVAARLGMTLASLQKNLQRAQAMAGRELVAA